MSAFWKMIIELAIRIFFEWLEKEQDEKKRIETASAAGTAVRAFMKSYNGTA